MSAVMTQVGATGLLPHKNDHRPLHHERYEVIRLIDMESKNASTRGSRRGDREN